MDPHFMCLMKDNRVGTVAKVMGAGEVAAGIMVEVLLGGRCQVTAEVLNLFVLTHYGGK